VKKITEIRKDFSILSTSVYGKPLVYLDNAATTQKPSCVIEAMNEVYTEYNANVHRGVHFLSDKASEAYENAREKIRAFLNASQKEEIIFTPGTTGSINLVAYSFGERFVKKGDEIIISTLEHHSNIVPWQMLCDRKGATLKVIPVDDNCRLVFEEYTRMLSKKTRLVAVTQVSNATGVVLPVKEIIEEAHRYNIPVLVDGAQGVQHGMNDVMETDCDFYAFSGHKIYGPAGIGVLYGKREILESMPPFQGGGDMIEKVTFEKTTYNALPFKFEAGTTNFPGAIGLARAIDYLRETGPEYIESLEKDLLSYTWSALSEIPGLKMAGGSVPGVPVFSFNLEGVHHYDAGMVLDKLGIAVRTGNHCAQPLIERLGLDGTIRASLCFYNTREEVDTLIEGINRVRDMFF